MGNDTLPILDVIPTVDKDARRARWRKALKVLAKNQAFKCGSGLLKFFPEVSFPYFS
jgi:hypothetical protein